MPTLIGRFEILSELSKSPTGVVYKANDPESAQTIALKAIQLSAFGESAAAVEQALVAEAERTKVLSSSNIATVLSADVIDGQFCAAMEYIQGNSIATMLARKEGFSIWDLLDIGRQLCSGLDHAASQSIVHCSLEPSKIMCGWDGTVKILGFGVSSVGNFVRHLPEGLPSILHYMSPEQIRGDAMDGRSNLFSLGAMFYEMVTERKAFDREDAESLRQCILESTPVPPLHVNPKIHPLLSDLILKALAKDPAQRYQTGRQLLDDLEKCKESKPAAAKKPEAPKAPAPPAQSKAATQTKFVAPAAARPATTPSVSVESRLAQPAKPAAAAPLKPTPPAPTGRLAAPKTAAAAAGVGGDATVSSPEAQQFDRSNRSFSSGATEKPSAYMSSAVTEEPEIETFEPQSAPESPKIAVDPMMAGGGPSGQKGTSFSEISELPPLKEVYVAPEPPPPVAYEPVPEAAPKITKFQGTVKHVEKPKVQPREVAQKAIKEIKGVPPKLMAYALGGAAAAILVIGIGVTIYIHVLNSDDDSAKGRAAAVAEAPPQPAASQPAPTAAPATSQPADAQPTEIAEPEAPAEAPDAAPRSRNARRKAASAPTVVPGQLSVDSTPPGAQVQVDGSGDASWVTPLALTNLQPGQHSITVSKAGYTTDTRTVVVPAGSRATAAIRLTSLMATLVVKSDPPGAGIFVDGRDMGMKTPAQISVDKGQHVVLVRMLGYLDETMNGQFTLGQTFNFSPTLRALGSTDNMKTVGKMPKLFGGKGEPGQTRVSVHTQPKGAQVAINQHMLEKNSPVDVMLDPGNYVIDITLTGYAPVHKVVNVDRSGKVAVDEVLQPQ